MKNRTSRRKKTPSRTLIAVTVVLAVLLMAAVLIIVSRDSRRVPEPAAEPVETGGPVELLIKGCLFDLGIGGKDVSFSGNTVRVRPRSPLSEERISRAFSPLADAGELRIEGASHIRVTTGAGSWDVYFDPAPVAGARCAIIVDDMGLNLKWARALGAIDAQLTFSVLPDRPFSVRAARYLHGLGREVLLHLPMEGNGKDPGKGAIYRDMSRSEILSVVRKNLRSVPHVVGVNNHMGSRITPEAEIMRLVLGEVRSKGLFFVDSLTTSKSVCRQEAQRAGVSFVSRDVFLDNERNDEYITGQLDKLVKIAQKHSQAVAICHPYPETISVLAREVPRIRERGVEIVPVSALVSRSGDAP